MTTTFRPLALLFFYAFIVPLSQLTAQDRTIDFRQGPLSYWQQEFGSITHSAHWTMPDSRGEGIILRNVAGYGSEVNMASHPFIEHQWSGDIIIKDWAPNRNWCGSLEIALHQYSGGKQQIAIDSYSTYGGGYKSLKLQNVTCNDEKGCYIRVKMKQGYGTGNSNMNYLRSITITNYYGTLSQDDFGNVAIDTQTDTGYKLQVAGGIRSTAVTVSATPWPDYVFDPQYDLKPLEEVKTYIEKNGHLPEIPSADEIEKGGVDLGEMNRLLIQKMEEMTLYQIELMELLKQQSVEIEQLKSKIGQ